MYIICFKKIIKKNEYKGVAFFLSILIVIIFIYMWNYCWKIVMGDQNILYINYTKQIIIKGTGNILKVQVSEKFSNVVFLKNTFCNEIKAI